MVESPRERDSEGNEEDRINGCKEVEENAEGTGKTTTRTDPNKEALVNDRTIKGCPSGGADGQVTAVVARQGLAGRQMLNYPENSRESTASSVYNVGFDL